MDRTTIVRSSVWLAAMLALPLQSSAHAAAEGLQADPLAHREARVLIEATRVVSAWAADARAALGRFDLAAPFRQLLRFDSCHSSRVAFAGRACTPAAFDSDAYRAPAFGAAGDRPIRETRFALDPAVRESHWQPYYRIERFAPGYSDVPPGVAGSVRAYERQVVGFRHDFGDLVALRLEFARTSEQAAGGEQKASEIRARVAVRF